MNDDSNTSLNAWRELFAADGNIPETTLASLYDQDAEVDMFHSAVVELLDSLFLFNAGIAEWKGQ